MRPALRSGTWSVCAAYIALACSSVSQPQGHATAPQPSSPTGVVTTSAPSQSPLASATPSPEHAPPDAGADASAAEAIGASGAAPAPGKQLSVEEVLALAPSTSTSIGAPGAGSVEGSVALPDQGPGFAHNIKRPDEARYGTVELVQSIARAAAATQAAHPETTVVVNDLGLEHGGPIAQHGSHQAGRDVDILFQILDRKRQPMPSVGVPLDPQGHGWDFKDLALPKDDVFVRFDAKRTWRFIAELITASGDEMQRIFLVEHLRTLLLAEAERVHAKKAITERFAMLTCQPEMPHDDHMHVRFFCSAEDIGRGCIDGSPIYPFRRSTLRTLDLKPVVETYADRHKRKREQEVDDRTTSLAEARMHIEKSGPLHARVKAFLDAREGWSKKPSPGRPYCK